MSDAIYRKEGNEYIFSLDGKDVFRTKKVAILFDKKYSVLLRHGQPELVHKDLEKMSDRCIATGNFDILVNLTVLESDEFDVATLNKTIAVSNFVGALWRAMEENANNMAIDLINRVSKK